MKKVRASLRTKTGVRYIRLWGFQVVDRKSIGADTRHREFVMCMPYHPRYPGPFSICFWRFGVNIHVPLRLAKAIWR